MVSPTCRDADVDVGQRGQVASPGEESIGHLNENEDEETLNTKISLSKDQITSIKIKESTVLSHSWLSLSNTRLCAVFLLCADPPERKPGVMS